MIENDPILWTMLNAIKEQQAQIQLLQEEIDEFLTSAEAALSKLTSEGPATGDKHNGQSI